jgi:tetratricopeptide (TPR) repeat protein
MPVDSDLKKQLETAMDLQLAGNLAEAEVIYRQILDSDPDQPDAVHLLGLVRMEQEQDEEAVVLMERALQLFPQAPHFHHNIAGLYRRMGRLADAETEFRAAIELKPDYGEAYQGLAEMVKFGPGDPLLGQINDQLTLTDLEDNLRSYFHFAAGKILDDTGAYPDAFQHFALGNQLTGRHFDSQQFRKLVKDLIYIYSRSWIERQSQAGLDTEVPVFIVGMPRSGTTLLEQILASHSSVFGAGELNDMKVIAALTQKYSSFQTSYPNSLPGLKIGDYRRLGEEYLKRISQLPGDASVARIIDKHPLNFQFVGLIFTMFPRARVIHTVRNPLDTCLSCFFQNFTKGQDYSFDLKSLAFFYNDYRRLMEHWETVYPGRILSVRYEDVIDDQGQETRRMLDYLGLNFEAACLEFHKTERKVSTASFLQVRKPLYNSSRQRWMNYRTELAELAEIIGIRTEAPITITGGSPLVS